MCRASEMPHRRRHDFPCVITTTQSYSPWFLAHRVHGLHASGVLPRVQHQHGRDTSLCLRSACDNEHHPVFNLGFPAHRVHGLHGGDALPRVQHQHLLQQLHGARHVPQPPAKQLPQPVARVLALRHRPRAAGTCESGLCSCRTCDGISYWCATIVQRLRLSCQGHCSAPTLHTKGLKP
jgi:hypothetical protein